MGKDLEINTSMKGNAAVIAIKGDVTAVTGSSIEQVYNGDEVSKAEKIVFCFDKNCYINSGGLAFLIDIAAKCRKKKQRVCATGLSEHFQKIFRMVGLSRCLEIVATEEIALQK